MCVADPPNPPANALLLLQARADKLREAGLLDIDELKTSVWADDPAGDKLQMLPGVEQLAGVFRETLQQLIDETLEKGATYAKLLATEVAEMQSALAETRKVRLVCCCSNSSVVRL